MRDNRTQVWRCAACKHTVEGFTFTCPQCGCKVGGTYMAAAAPVGGQAEPSDAEIDAAMRAFWSNEADPEWRLSRPHHRETFRSVLRAAAAVSGEQAQPDEKRCEGIYPHAGRGAFMVRCPQADGHEGVCGPAAGVGGLSAGTDDGGETQ